MHATADAPRAAVPAAPESKLPAVGTTIFSVMSALAAEHGALNLSQGFPDFDGPEALLDRVNHYLRSGANQYAPMPGVPALREAIAGKTRDLYGHDPDPATDITVTSGATEALFCAIHAVVRPGDEVILFDPAYDSYEPAVELAGGHCVHLPLLAPDYRVDWDRVRDAITPRTRMIIVNSPHNPTGSVFTPADLDALEAVVADTDIWLLSDEVYEHIVFEGDHHSPLEFAETDNVLAISACSKTYSMTGWRLGWVVASNRRIERMLRVHQYGQACASAPAQYAAEAALTGPQDRVQEMVDTFEQRRDLVLDGLTDAGLEVPTPEGAFYAMPKVPDGWCEEVLERGVVVVPGDAFGANGEGYARLSYATGTEELKEALEIMDDATRAVR